MTVELTQSQIENLAEFIEFNLIKMIRVDVDIDNIDWVKDMCEVHTKLKEALEGSGGE